MLVFTRVRISLDVALPALMEAARCSSERVWCGWGWSCRAVSVASVGWVGVVRAVKPSFRVAIASVWSWKSWVCFVRRAFWRFTRFWRVFSSVVSEAIFSGASVMWAIISVADVLKVPARSLRASALRSMRVTACSMPRNQFLEGREFSISCWCVSTCLMKRSYCSAVADLYR